MKIYKITEASEYLGMPPIREFEIFCGDCRDILPTLPRLADACICDPPYGLKFMGKGWDHGVPGPDFWKAILDACKPGAHLLAFGGTRTFHRLGCAIEDAGWEIRDTLMWVYGSGFPKSHNVGLRLDKMAGHGDRGHRIAVANRNHPDGTPEPNGDSLPPYEGKTELGKKWQGWGTALKPAWEPIFLARKPLDGTVAENVQKHGTGALNIDACRIPIDAQQDDPRLGGKGEWSTGNMAKHVYEGGYAGDRVGSSPLGRWPANLAHDGSEEVMELFPESNSTANIRHNNQSKTSGQKNGATCYGKYNDCDTYGYSDSGSAARFFYCAKASKQDRDEGCESMPAVKSGMSNGAQLHGEGYDKGQDIGLNRVIQRRNHHPTVKPTALMRYLVKLVSRPGHTILDPFSGSGSTGKAAILEARQFLGIELQPEYVQIATARLSHAVKLHQESSAQHSAVTHH